ncbi:hypothetical protein GS931_11375 [Rhodococcus hoagii]|nr:hypothetical protein [Prescottella equi]
MLPAELLARVLGQRGGGARANAITAAVPAATSTAPSAARTPTTRRISHHVGFPFVSSGRMKHDEGPVGPDRTDSPGFTSAPTALGEPTVPTEAPIFRSRHR